MSTAPGRRGGAMGLEAPTAKIDFSESYSTETLGGQSVLITGGATGLGQDAAIAFAEAGALVTVADINDDGAAKTVEALTAKGLKATFIKTDVTQWNDLVAAFKRAVEFGGGLDIVIPSAGITGAGATNGKWLETVGKDDNGDPLPLPTKVTEINAHAVFLTAHLALYYFKQNPKPEGRSKQIIFISSMAGYSSMTGQMDYCTSKWAVRGLFRSMRGATKILGEGAPTLRCNLLAPGFIKTPMTTDVESRLEQMGIKLGVPADVTRVALRMASDEKVMGMSTRIGCPNL